MNPNAVLTDEEKVVRFRKTILKRLKTMEDPSNENRRKKSENVSPIFHLVYKKNVIVRSNSNVL